MRKENRKNVKSTFFILDILPICHMVANSEDNWSPREMSTNIMYLPILK